MVFEVVIDAVKVEYMKACEHATEVPILIGTLAEMTSILINH